MSHEPFWRVLWAVNKKPAADIYTPAGALAKRIAQAISDIHGAKMALVELVPGNAADRPYAPKDWRGMTDWVPVPRKNPLSRLRKHVSGKVAERESRLSVPDKHRLKIARDTLKMSDAGANIIGGPTKAEARQIIFELTGAIAAIDNPTLVHHGRASEAWWHVLEFGSNNAIADLYGAVGKEATAQKVAKAIAAAMGKRVVLLYNAPGKLMDHPVQGHYGGNKANPAARLEAGQTWRGIADGAKDRVVSVIGKRVQVLHLDAGNREWLDAGDFLATHKMIDPARRNPSRSRRAKFQRATSKHDSGWRSNPRIKDLGNSVAVTMSAREVEAFARTWPASGLSAKAITFEFSYNGDLVDLKSAGNIERAEGSGALPALSQDAWAAYERRVQHEDALGEERFNRGVRRTLRGNPAPKGRRTAVSKGCGVNAPHDNPRDRTFKSLAVGDVFRFTSERDFPNSGMARGPWRKTGTRSYVRDEPGTLLTGITLKVGSINATVLPDGPISNPSKLGKSGKLKWSTLAGGTSAWEGARGYAARTEFGGYHINPVTTQYGRRAGYSVMFEIGGPGLSPLPDSMRQSGLWRDLGEARSPNEAKAVAQEHHDEILIEIRGQAYNAGAGAPQREAISATGRRSASPVADMAAAFTWPEWHKLTLSEAGLILQDIADLSDSWTDAEGHGDDLRAARELARRVGAGNLKSYAATLGAGRQPGERLRKNPRWESRSGKHWVELTGDESGYSYRAPGAGGFMGKITEAEAIAEIERLNAAGYFQPDANKTPMRRVNPRRSLHGAGELARAHNTFKMWHEFDSSKVVKMRGPDPMIPKTLVGLGRLSSVVYESDKYAGGPDNPKGERLLYEHEFKHPRPMLATDPDGRNLHIVGGRVKVTRNGLVN